MPDPELIPVRFVEGAEDVVEGLAVPFGGPFPGDIDAYRTRFDKADLHLDWYDRRPILYHHGKNPGPQLEVVGWVRTADISDFDEDGVRGKWVKGELDKSARYHAEVAKLVKAGALGWSHGTISYLVDAEPPARDGTRNIREWPIVEFSLTPFEASPFYSAAAMRSVPDVVWEILGTTEDEIAVRGWLPEGTTPGDLDDGDFAWVSDDGKTRKLPYKIHGKVNEAGWKAAWSRAHQDATQFDGGPSQADTIKKLLADAPEGVDTKYDDGKTPVPGRSADVEPPPAGALPPQRGIQTFADIQAGAVMDDELPDAISTLQSAIWGAIYATDKDFNPETPDAKKAAISASLEQFGTYVLGLVDRAQAAAGRSMAFIIPPAPPVKPFRAGARNSAADQGHLDTAHASAHMAVDHTYAIGATCDDCAAAHQSGDDGSQQNTGAASDDSNDDDGDAAPGRSADLGPVFTVMSDVDAAVRASALERADEVGKRMAADLRR